MVTFSKRLIFFAVYIGLGGSVVLVCETAMIVAFINNRPPFTWPPLAMLIFVLLAGMPVALAVLWVLTPTLDRVVNRVNHTIWGEP